MCSVTALCSEERTVAVGYSSGCLTLFIWSPISSIGGDSARPPVAEFACDAHAGGTLGVVLTHSTQRQLIISSGGDGWVRVWGTELGVPLFAHAVIGADATRGPYGMLLELLVADPLVWATAAGRSVVVGQLHMPGQDMPGKGTLTMEPLPHAIDDLQLLPNGTIAVASFGGVTLFHRTASDTKHSTVRTPTQSCTIPNGYPTLPTMHYIRVAGSERTRRDDIGASLPFNGWVRSLLASPNGKWLAAHVSAAGRQVKSAVGRVSRG
mmetsp:Transcript_59628/g.132779  ORF Transcript_59628/g.132779 Transcript_59628/m.132779 type:complete len:266 (+) Transcript_59628:170-967(+)